MDDPSKDGVGSPMRVSVSGSADVDTEKMSLAQTNAALAKENARLAQENAMAQQSAALAIENARLIQENAMLHMQTAQMQMPPPAYYAGFDGNPWAAQGYYPMSWPGADQAQHVPKGRGRGKKVDRTASGGSTFSTFTPPNSFGGAPKSFGESSADGAGEEASTAAGVLKGSTVQTSVMMRNLPNNYTRQMLEDLINEHGFTGRFDLLYLPVDFKTESGLGYAFVNLVSYEAAADFRQHFQGFSEWAMLSEKVCEVTWSDVLQGLHAHVERYRNSPVMHESVPDQFKPALYKEGTRVDFPAPNKKIRPPRPLSHKLPSAS